MAGPAFDMAPARKLIGLRKIDATHPEVKELQDALAAFAAEVNARFLESYFHGIPIGVPFAFLPDFFPEGYRLGEKFAACDGRAIVNKTSPIHGKTLPTITDDLGSGETVTWYVRIRD